MWEAKWGMFTKGKIRKRVLYAKKRMFLRRASADQPMNRSRGPRCRGADDQARHAIGRPRA